MKRRISISLKGGLGNQLFQFFACLTIARRANFTPFVFTYSFESDKYARTLELQPLLNSFNVEVLPYPLIHSFKYIYEGLITHPTFFSSTHNPLSNDTLWPSDYVLDGYFFDSKFIDPSIVELARPIFQSATAHLDVDYKFCSIHFRELHGQTISSSLCSPDTLSFDYYKTCIDYIILNCSDPSLCFVIFSDLWKDISQSSLVPLVVEYIDSLGYRILYGDTLCGSPFEVISLMSRSTFSIIANSTMSWWGAYLSSARLVCSPRMSLWEPDLHTPSSWLIFDTSNSQPVTHSRAFSFFSNSYFYVFIRLVNIFPHFTKRIVSICLAFVFSVVKSLLKFKHSYLFR